MEHPKTIQIFLPDGSPSSIKIADITSRIAQSILIPRNKIKEAENRIEIKNVGLYFLFGEIENKAKPVVYIGEAEDCSIRIKQHNQSKEFWNTCIIVISKTNNFTKAHVKYLEWYCTKITKQSSRYELENTILPSEPYITEPVKADLLDHFDTIKILLSTLGFPIFDNISKLKDKNLLICKGKKASAHGEFLDNGFVVFKDSTANIDETPTINLTASNLRKKLLENGILVKENNKLVFKSDYIFSSPSTAAATVLARSANGWTEWKNKDGKTLDLLYRKI